MSSPYWTLPKYGGSVRTASRLSGGTSIAVELVQRICTDRSGKPSRRSPIHSFTIGTLTFRPPRRRTSKGASQYCFARTYFSTIFAQPPEPTFAPPPFTLPSMLDSHCTKPTGNPWTEKISSDFNADVS